VYDGRSSQVSKYIKRRKTMKANGKTEAAVMEVFNQFNKAYAQRDIDTIMALVAPDPDLVLLGTGADERRVGPAELKFQAERDWSQSEALAFELGWNSISAAGSVAWLAAEATGRGKVGGQEISFPVRLSAVLEQREGKWLFVQMHLSSPAPGQAEGESIPT
jgi:ketosteroid isomerase-like protein